MTAEKQMQYLFVKIREEMGSSKLLTVKSYMYMLQSTGTHHSR